MNGEQAVGATYPMSKITVSTGNQADEEVLAPTVGIEPSDSMGIEPSEQSDQMLAFERHDSRIWEATKTGVRAIGRTAVSAAQYAAKGATYLLAGASEVTNLLTHGIGSVENFRQTAQACHTAVDYVGRHSTRVARDWHAKPWSKEKATAPIVGSLAWANLVFGESIALMGQGLVEHGSTNGVLSFMTHMAIATAVEVGFTYPIARRNDRHRASGERGLQPTTGKDIIDASATAFWLGGAMGVEDKDLGRKHMAIPIASYLGFAALLATAGNYHDFASRIIESPAFFGVLVMAGIIKKTNEVLGYEGIFERLAVKTVDVLDVNKRHEQKAERAVAKQAGKR